MHFCVQSGKMRSGAMPPWQKRQKTPGAGGLESEEILMWSVAPGPPSGPMRKRRRDDGL